MCKMLKILTVVTQLSTVQVSCNRPFPDIQVTVFYVSCMLCDAKLVGMGTRGFSDGGNVL